MPILCQSLAKFSKIFLNFADYVWQDWQIPQALSQIGLLASLSVHFTMLKTFIITMSTTTGIIWGAASVYISTAPNFIAGL